MAVTVGAIGVAVAASGFGYQVESGQEADDKARAAQQKAQEDQNAAIAKEKAQEAKALTDQQTADTQDANLQARNKTRSDLAASQAALGRSGTILTSPLGLPGTNAPNAKTLLGQ